MLRKQKIYLWLPVCAVFVIASVLTFVFAIMPLFNKDEKSRLFDIKSVAIILDGKIVTELEPFEFDKYDSLSFTVLINGGVEIDEDKYDLPTVEWSFVGNNLNNTITDGELDLTMTALGVMKIQVKVTSNNSMTAVVGLSVTAKEGSVLDRIEITSPPKKVSYTEGQRFDKSGMIVDAVYFHDSEEYRMTVENYTIEPNDNLQFGITEIMILYTDGITKSELIPITVSRNLLSIFITPPIKTTYTEGQLLDLTGLRVFEKYEVSTKEIDAENYVVDFDTSLPLTLSDTQIRIIHSSGKQTVLELTINHRTVMSIDVFGVKTSYLRHQQFDTSNLTVLANYDYGASKFVTGFHVNKTDNLTLADDGTDVIISYTENDETVSRAVKISVALPYQNLRTIKIDGNPADITLSWIYSYPSEDGESSINDWLVLTHEDKDLTLVYDKENGEYLVPVDALVTITKNNNPSITDFIIDGVPQGIGQQVGEMTFTVSSESDATIIISYETVIGERIIVRFIQREIDYMLVFYFSENWNGQLHDSYMERIKSVFYETDSYSYEFEIGGEVYMYSDFDFQSKDESEKDVYLLTEFIENTNEVVINVMKKEREPLATKELTLILWQGTADKNIVVPADVDWLSDWETYDTAPQRNGYDFIGWEVVVESENTYRAKWTCWTEFGDIENHESYVGSWINGDSSFIFTNEGDYIYSGKATYEYLDGTTEEKDFVLYGIYRVEDGKIVVKTVETEFDYSLVELTDFAFELDEYGLFANSFEVMVKEVIENIEISEGVFESITTFSPSVETVKKFFV